MQGTEPLKSQFYKMVLAFPLETELIYPTFWAWNRSEHFPKDEYYLFLLSLFKESDRESLISGQLKIMNQVKDNGAIRSPSKNSIRKRRWPELILNSFKSQADPVWKCHYRHYCESQEIRLPLPDHTKAIKSYIGALSEDGFSQSCWLEYLKRDDRGASIRGAKIKPNVGIETETRKSTMDLADCIVDSAFCHSKTRHNLCPFTLWVSLTSRCY